MQEVERGRIAEPVLCPNCSTNHSFFLIHNRCKFSDKQRIKLQVLVDTGFKPIIFLWQEAPNDEVSNKPAVFLWQQNPNDKVSTKPLVFLWLEAPNDELPTYHMILTK